MQITFNTNVFTGPLLSGNSFNDTTDAATFTTTEGGTFVWATHLTTESVSANGSGGWTGTTLETGTDTVATSGETTISAAYTATTGTGGESRKFSYYVRDAAGNDSNVITETFTVNSSWTPSDLFLSAQKGAWLDFSDTSTLWTTSARSVQVASDSDPIGYVDDKSGNGVNFQQVTGGRLPLWRSATNSAEFDNTDDHLLNVASITGYTTTMAVCMAVKTTDTNFLILNSNTGGNYLGVAEDGSVSTTLSGNAGSPTYRINGTPFAGTTRDDLHTAIATGSVVSVVIENVDLSTSSNWATVTRIGSYSGGGVNFGGNVLAVVIREALTTDERSSLETYLQGL